MFNKLVSIAVALILASTTVLAGEKEDVHTMVNDAAAAVVKEKAGALSEISNPKGRFVKGAIYVFAYNLTGTMAAHPINAKLVGKPLLDVPDAAGKMFRKDIIKGVKASGTATVDYKYKNPKTGAIEDKVTYCKKAADLAVCAGYYK